VTRREDPNELTVFGHLEEMRRRLWICVIALGAAVLGAYFASERLVELLIAPLRGHGSGEVYFFSPQGAFVVRVKAALLAGACASAPVLLHQAWMFLSPGLLRHERRAIVPLACVTGGLFAGGAAFAYAVVLPRALEFLLSMGGPSIRPMISVEEYLSFASMLILAFGFAFNLPVLILGLVAVGATDARSLNRFQKQVVVGIFIAAAMLTPGPDVASQLLLALPLLALFELSVLVAYFLRPGRRAAETGNR
jgi:sec-independent protein translocase protein TatC